MGSTPPSFLAAREGLGAELLVGVGIGMVMGRRWSKTWELSRVEPSRAKFGLWMLDVG
jgi:hypothetical protein